MEIGKIESLCTAKVTAEVREGFDWLITFKHEDFPFECVIHDRVLGKNWGTTNIHVSDSDMRKIYRDLGYTEKSHIDNAEYKVEHRNKYGDLKAVEAPKKVTLSKADTKKLESFYQNWFEYWNTTKYLPVMEELESIKNQCGDNETKIKDVLSQCKNSKLAKKGEYKVDNNSTVTNEYARLSFSESNGSVRLDMNDWKFTDEQKIKLFILLDSFDK